MATDLTRLTFAQIYPLYVQKAARKGRTQVEVDAVLGWLTGYAPEDLARVAGMEVDLRTFFAEAPALHPHRHLVTGVVCGVRVEALEDPLVRDIRRMDKLIDELAKGRPLVKILRAPQPAETGSSPG